MSTTTKPIRTQQEMAAFYLSPMPYRTDGKFWWETMDRTRMKKIVRDMLASDHVKPETKTDLEKIAEKL